MLAYVGLPGTYARRLDGDLRSLPNQHGHVGPETGHYHHLPNLDLLT